MPKPPKPPMIKKSLDWHQSHYDEIVKLARKQKLSWAEMAREVVDRGIKASKAALISVL